MKSRKPWLSLLASAAVMAACQPQPAPKPVATAAEAIAVAQPSFEGVPANALKAELKEGLWTVTGPSPDTTVRIDAKTGVTSVDILVVDVIKPPGK